MASGAIRYCPLCQRGDLRRHCPRGCGWERCHKCHTTFDPVGNRAHDERGHRVAWPKHWPEGAAS